MLRHERVSECATQSFDHSMSHVIFRMSYYMMWNAPTAYPPQAHSPTIILPSLMGYGSKLNLPVDI